LLLTEFAARSFPSTQIRMFREAPWRATCCRGPIRTSPSSSRNCRTKSASNDVCGPCYGKARSSQCGRCRSEDSRWSIVVNCWRKAIGFCPTEIIFLFLVGRYSDNFAPPCCCKSFVTRWLARGGGAKFPEFRPGGGAKPFLGGAKFVRHFEAPPQLSKTPPYYFWTTDAIWDCPISPVRRGDRCA
jgi:hypothetical protein